MFMDITLHQLRIFRAVARHRSYSRAADALCISQPGVSLQVRALERHVGLALFARRGRAVELTEAGRALLDYGERVLALLDEAQVACEELAGGRRGAIRVAASPSAGIYVVPPALGAFHRAAPAVQLSLDVVDRFTARERLLTDEADLAVMGLLEDTAGLEVVPFVPNDLVVIASPRHPLVPREGIAFEELAGESFLVREAWSGTRVDTERLFAAPGVPLRVGMELRSSGAIKQAVAADLGIAIMPLAALELELVTGRLVILDVRGFPVRRYWKLVRRAGKHHPAAAAALWDFLLAHRDALAGAEGAAGRGGGMAAPRA
jgi:LysR family transcriptional regulator, low CO2-responsive transcriptional regulator